MTKINERSDFCFDSLLASTTPWFDSFVTSFSNLYLSSDSFSRIYYSMQPIKYDTQLSERLPYLATFPLYQVAHPKFGSGTVPPTEWTKIPIAKASWRVHSMRSSTRFQSTFHPCVVPHQLVSSILQCLVRFFVGIVHVSKQR